MKVVQVNAILGERSTGTIMANIQKCCQNNGIEAYVAYSIAGVPKECVFNGFKIGNLFDEEIHALLSRFKGKQAYFSYIPTIHFLRYLDSIRPDIVHLHNLHNNYINLNLLLKYLAKRDIATVITMHDCWYFTGGCFHYTNAGCDKWQHGCGNCPKKMLDTPAYLCDASSQILQDRKKYLTSIPRLYLVGCSKWVADEARKSVLKDCDIRYIYNGFDLDVFKPTSSELVKKLEIEGKHILLGPASKWQSAVNKETLDYFIQTMPEDYVLVLFGANEHNKYISPNVLLYRYTSSREEMAQLYSMADVFVNCSREDTLSSLNLEAQACGTPVVTYDATGSMETVNGKCGFAVETGNYRLLLNKVLVCALEGKAMLSSQCRRWITSQYNMDKNYQEYVNLYSSICQNK